MFLKQHPEPFYSLKNPELCVLEVVQIFEATKCGEILFKIPKCFNKVYEAPQYHPVKSLAFLTII